MECVSDVIAKMETLMILTIYLGILNLDKASTLKSNISISQIEKDLPVLTSKGCRPEYLYNPNRTMTKVTFVIPVITRWNIPKPYLLLLDQKFLNTTAFNILFIEFNPSCQYTIHQFLLDQLLGENFNGRKYFLLTLLVFFIPNSDLLNYLSMLSTYNVPVISLSVTELNTGNYFYNNFLPYKTRGKAAANFLILFMTKANIKSLIILYDSTQKSKEIMLNFQEKLIERNSTICQLYTYYISTAKSNNSTVLEKIQTNKFTRYIFLISSNKTLIRFIFGLLENSKVMKTVILHDSSAGPNDRLKEDKLDFIFFKRKDKTVNGKISQALANAIKKFQLVLNFTNTVNITGRIMPKCFSDSFTSSLGIQVPISVSTSMYRKSIKDGVVKTVRYGKYRDRNPQATVKWFTSNIKLGFSFCQKNCRPGYYPIYTGHNRCCWVCKFCENKYFKTAEGQDECLKCDEKNSLTNENRTMCIPFTYHFFQIEGNKTNIVFILATIGSLYSTMILFVFVKNRKTPVVKSSNFPLSLIQIIFHAMQSLQLLISALKQTQMVCIFNAVTTGSIIKLIIAIHFVKTNQLLTVFQSTKRIKRKHFVKASEVVVPGAFVVANTLLDIIHLVHSTFEFGIYEKKAEHLRLRYCQMTSFFYIDVITVIFFSVICSIKAFSGRRLPSNYNEMRFIFLGTFTLIIQMLLSLILHANFQNEGTVIFVDSLVVFFASFSVLTITYGYKVYIVLFCKNKNTTAAFKTKLFRLYDNEFTIIQAK